LALPSAVATDNIHLLAPGKWAEMHENSNLFLSLIEINNMHRTRHIFQYPGPIFGAGADGAVFRDIAGKNGADWYPVLPVKLLALYGTLSLRSFDLVSVRQVGCPHRNSPPHMGEGSWSGQLTLGRSDWLPSNPLKDAERVCTLPPLVYDVLLGPNLDFSRLLIKE